MKCERTLAIIGTGPRGLHALEQVTQLLGSASETFSLRFLLFEATGHFGNGQVYPVNQSKDNWFNLSERGLTLEGRKAYSFGKITIPSFPSYHEWIGKDFTTIPEDTTDFYPSRGSFGRYLRERFETMAQPLLDHGIIRMIIDRIEKIDIQPDQTLSLIGEAGRYAAVNEVLLTIGHQNTEISEQLEKWYSFSTKHDDLTLFTSPYPIQDLLYSSAISTDRKVGIRGFGLAMIDVVRSIAKNYGKFNQMNQSDDLAYKPHEPDEFPLLVPFSLDGLPPAPKPLNAAQDKQYAPPAYQLKKFGATIGNHTIQKDAKDASFLIKAIAPVAAQIYRQLTNNSGLPSNGKKVEELIKKWLMDEEFKNELILPKDILSVKMLRQYTRMACGKHPISLDFCIGQVWRHCQPTIYEQLSFHHCTDETFSKVIALDERMKRYAYGPPVESIRQLLALVDAGVLTLDWLNNPEIEMNAEGWVLRSNEEEVTATTIVNSVLDAPQLSKVDTPLITQLKKADWIQAVHDSLGLVTSENGYIISRHSDHPPVAVLGRLAKGTIIGVDAILECFGNRTLIWAEEAARRHLRLTRGV